MTCFDLDNKNKNPSEKNREDISVNIKYQDSYHQDSCLNEDQCTKENYVYRIPESCKKYNFIFFISSCLILNKKFQFLKH